VLTKTIFFLLGPGVWVGRQSARLHNSQGRKSSTGRPLNGSTLCKLRSSLQSSTKKRLNVISITVAFHDFDCLPFENTFSLVLRLVLALHLTLVCLLKCLDRWEPFIFMVKTTATSWNDYSPVLIVIKAIITAVYCRFLRSFITAFIFPSALLNSALNLYFLGPAAYFQFKMPANFFYFAIGPKGFWCNSGGPKIGLCCIEKFFLLVFRMGKVVMWLMSTFPVTTGRKSCCSELCYDLQLLKDVLGVLRKGNYRHGFLELDLFRHLRNLPTSRDAEK